MRNLVTFSVCFLTTVLSTAVSPVMAVENRQLWVQDTPHCKAIFKVGHDNNITSVTGWFSRVTGTLTYDGKNLKDASVEARILVDSLSTGNEARDQHLLSENFFDQAKFPFIKFKSTSVSPVSAGKFKVTGDLEIKGKKKVVTLECIGPRGPVLGDNNRTRVGFNATTKINRKDFGVSWNREVSPGVFMVADDVDITLELEFIKMEQRKSSAAPR